VKNCSESSLLLMRYKHCITERTLPWTSMCRGWVYKLLSYIVVSMFVYL